MRQVVRDMCEVRVLRFQPLHQLQRVPHRRMRGMRMVPQRIEKQDVESLQSFQRLFRDVAEVREVRGRAEAIGFDRGISVEHLEWCEYRSEEVHRPIHRSQLYLRQTAILVIRLEDVAENGTQRLRRGIAGVEGNLAAAGHAGKAERSYVVESKNVIGVAVGVK